MRHWLVPVSSMIFPARSTLILNEVPGGTAAGRLRRNRMKLRIRDVLLRLLSVALAMVLVAAPLVGAQEKATQEQPAAKPFKPEELEQIVAPIALYPDPLVAQVMMA